MALEATGSLGERAWGSPFVESFRDEGKKLFSLPSKIKRFYPEGCSHRAYWLRTEAGNDISNQRPRLYEETIKVLKRMDNGKPLRLSCQGAILRPLAQVWPLQSLRECGLVQARHLQSYVGRGSLPNPGSNGMEMSSVRERAQQRFRFFFFFFAFVFK